VTAYLLVVNPNSPNGLIKAWKAGIQVDMWPETGHWELHGEYSINVGSGDDFVVGAALSPYDASGDAVVLLSRDMLFTGTDGEYALFEISGVSGSINFPNGPGYAYEVDGNIEFDGIFFDSCAWINQSCD